MKTGTTRKLILTIEMRQLKVLGCLLIKEGLENLTWTGYIDGKRNRK